MDEYEWRDLCEERQKEGKNKRGGDIIWMMGWQKRVGNLDLNL